MGLYITCKGPNLSPQPVTLIARIHGHVIAVKILSNFVIIALTETCGFYAFSPHDFIIFLIALCT